MTIARELAAPLEGGATLSDILSNALSPLDPSNKNSDSNSPKKEEQSCDSSQNGSGDGSECASTSSMGSNSSHSKAPGAQLSQSRMIENNHLSSPVFNSQQPQHEAIQAVSAYP